MSKSKVKDTTKIAPPGSVKEAIEEQQSRVWRLRNLIECIRQVADSSDAVEDFGAAISGLQDYADDIHMTLDAGLIAERATVIEEERRDTPIGAAVDIAAGSEATPTRQ